MMSDLSRRSAGKVNLGNALVSDLPPRATVPTSQPRVKVDDTIAPQNYHTTQVQIGTTPTLIAAARAQRSAIKITNLGVIDVYLGNGKNLLTTNGDLLLGTKGSFQIIPTQSAIWGIAASATTVSVAEVFN